MVSKTIEQLRLENSKLRERLGNAEKALHTLSNSEERSGIVLRKLTFVQL